MTLSQRFLWGTGAMLILIPVVMLWVKFGATVFVEMALSKMSLCF